MSEEIVLGLREERDELLKERDELHAKIAKLYLELSKSMSEQAELQHKLDAAINTLGIYADDRSWFKTPTLTQWLLTPNPTLLAREQIKRLKGE